MGSDSQSLMSRFLRQHIVVITAFERALALAVFAGVIAYLIGSVQVLLSMDWTSTETFYELVYRVLLLVIGLELMRMLVTHELEAILELLAFVIARKMLKPDLTSIDIVLSVLGFVALVAARFYFFNRRDRGVSRDSSTEQQSPNVDER